MKAAVFPKIGDISVDTVEDPEIVRTGKVTLNDIITHRFPLNKASHAYDIFKNKQDDCVKVVLTP